MTKAMGNGSGSTVAGVPVMLPGMEAGHLHKALEQMDLLLRAERVDVALVHLVDMLRHMRAIAVATG